MKEIYFNAHSLGLNGLTAKEMLDWKFKLQITLSLFGIKWDNVYFTFDDFYIDELLFISKLFEIEFTKNIYIFYCANLLDASDMSKSIGKLSEEKIPGGKLSDLQALKIKYPEVKIGMHGFSHESYEQINDPIEVQRLFTAQLDFHSKHFKDDKRIFAFPYGRASKIAVNEASNFFENIFLSDNRLKITTPRVGCANKLINRRHLEICGGLLKLFIVLILNKLK